MTCEALSPAKFNGDERDFGRMARCKRSATITVAGKCFCEQHAKMALGVPSDVRLSAADFLR